jgi:hypothetical protein
VADTVTGAANISYVSYLFIYLFMVYLTTLTAARQVGPLVNNELERMWKQTVVV